MLFQWLQRSYSLPGIPKHDFLEIHENSWNLMEFHETSWSSWNFTQILVLGAPRSARLLNPCFFLRKIKVSWRVADGWKPKIPWNLWQIMKFPEASWFFINSRDFYAFLKISALQRWHAKRTVIPMLFQWLRPPHSSPDTPKSKISWNFVKIGKTSWNFMKFSEI